jgi:hypothetical protein
VHIPGRRAAVKFSSSLMQDDTPLFIEISRTVPPTLDLVSALARTLLPWLAKT